MESMLLAQQKQDEYIKQLASKVDALTTHNKMLEAQIAQQASSSSIPLGRLLSKPDPNPREQNNAMILRGGKQLEGPKGVSSDESSYDENEHVENVNHEVPTPSDDVIDDVMHKFDEVPKNPEITSPKPYTTPLAFSQRMAKAKLDLQFRKFLEVLKNLYINILFTDALSQMPSYANFLKETLSNKRKLQEL